MQNMKDRRYSITDLRAVGIHDHLYLLMPDDMEFSPDDMRKVYFIYDSESQEISPPGMLQALLKYIDFERYDGDFLRGDPAMEKSDFREDQHPRANDGKFAPKGQGQASGGGNQANTTRNSAAVGAILGDVSPELEAKLKEFQEKHYPAAVEKVKEFGIRSGVLPIEMDKPLRNFKVNAEKDGAYSAYKTFLKEIDRSMLGRVDEADYTRLKNSIRVAEYHFIKKMDLEPNPVKVVPGKADKKPVDKKSVDLPETITGEVMAKKMANITDDQLWDADDKEWKEYQRLLGKVNRNSEKINQITKSWEASEYRMNNYLKTHGRESAEYKRARDEVDEFAKQVDMIMQDTVKLRREINKKNFSRTARLHKFIMAPEEMRGEVKTVLDTKPTHKGTLPPIDKIEKAAGFIKSMCDKRIFTTGVLNVDIKKLKPGASRAYAEIDGISVNKDHSDRVIVHEMAHVIELNNILVLKASKKFLENRTKGEKAVNLTDLKPGHGYDASEMVKPDKFPTAYCGKIYPHATEILSMGFEYMYDDPAHFARKDPEYFAFVFDVMRGKYEPKKPARRRS